MNKSCKSEAKKLRPRFEAIWTGKYPTPYLGEWIVKKDGKDITHFLPTDKRTLPAYTYGEYPVLDADPYSEVKSFVEDGLDTSDWIHQNLYWLQLMADTDEDYMLLYLAFHENDFRTLYSL